MERIANMDRIMAGACLPLQHASAGRRASERQRLTEQIIRKIVYQYAKQENYTSGRLPMTRTQLNLRVSEQLERAIDEKRIELRASLGTIPSRSDVLRFALEAYLSLRLSETEADRRSTTGPAKRKAR
jgi:Arc/MetJ-type ribon-helix-helix transcriptional regulator